MATANLDVWGALRSRVVTLNLASPLWPIWPIVYDGSTYVPVSNKPYLAVSKLNAPTQRTIINQRVADLSGSLLLSLVLPIGQAPEVYENLADRVIEHFQGCIEHKGTKLLLMSATGGTAYQTGGYRDGGWWRVPVSIPWRTRI